MVWGQAKGKISGRKGHPKENKMEMTRAMPPVTSGQKAPQH